MTKKELIEELEGYDDNEEVYLAVDGYCLKLIQVETAYTQREGRWVDVGIGLSHY